ncbi:MAG: DUF2298 domain-containing protein [Chloroflexi bacterium]|nr:DUF2298 domain-containing protein [Chloroflexota bacterium]
MEALAVWQGSGALRWLRLTSGFWYEGIRLRRLQRRYALTLPDQRPPGNASPGSAAIGVGALTLVGLAALALGLSGYALAATLVVALTPLLLLMARELRRPAPGGIELTLALGMAALALAIAAGIEVITLQGDIQRMNTVFKFYLQTWVLLALSASFAVWYLATGAWRRLRFGVAPASVRRLGAFIRPAMRPLALVGALLFAAGLIYPLAATPVRLRDRFQPLPPTLDGMAYMNSAVYQDERGPLTLAYDADAIRWLREHVDGSPPIAEGATPLYRWGGRVSINTGLPTILGWDWHQRQQRWGYQQMVDERIADVRRLYTDPAPATALDVLRKYGVQYLYVGELERRYYPPEGIAKFERMTGAGLELVYRNAEATIYRVTAGG